MVMDSSLDIINDSVSIWINFIIMIIARLFDLIINDLERKNLNALDFSSIGLVYKESKPTGQRDGKKYIC